MIKIWVVDMKSSCIASNLVPSTSINTIHGFKLWSDLGRWHDAIIRHNFFVVKHDKKSCFQAQLPVRTICLCFLTSMLSVLDRRDLSCRSCTTALPGHFELNDRLAFGQLPVVLKQVPGMISVALVGRLDGGGSTYVPEGKGPRKRCRWVLIDREHNVKRPVLIACGRTVVRAPPPKGQEECPNYLGTLAPKVKAVLVDFHTEMWKLRMSNAVMHNEVAPGQHETSPFGALRNVSADQNAFCQDVLSQCNTIPRCCFTKTF